MAKRMTKEQKIDDAILNCYRELFANSTPVGDFDKLMEEAEINDRGQKVIPFMDYEIDQDLFNKIVDKYANQKSLKFTSHYREAFKRTILLGCSPKFKSYEYTIKAKK